MPPVRCSFAARLRNQPAPPGGYRFPSLTALTTAAMGRPATAADHHVRLPVPESPRATTGGYRDLDGPIRSQDDSANTLPSLKASTHGLFACSCAPPGYELVPVICGAIALRMCAQASA